MIDYLKSSYKSGKMPNSSLISTNHPWQTLIDLKRFIQEILFKGNSLVNNPDYKIVERTTTTNKNITVEQIRELESFLFHTNLQSSCKVAIIYQADLMNHNAANCCLKLLEEAPSSYIFLITTRSANILPTILSRCAKIHHYLPDNYNDDVYLEFLEILDLQSNHIDKLLELLKKLSDKNRDQWKIIADNSLKLMSRLIKQSAGIEIKLHIQEKKIISGLRSPSTVVLLKKLKTIQNLIDNTSYYDLELRASCILLLKQFTV